MPQKGRVQATRRRPRGRKAREVVLRNPSNPMPDRFVTHMKYSTLVTLTTSGIGIPAYWAFRMNSIFDPDLSGTGHQPLSHDEFTPFYTKYTVTGMSYVVTFSNQSTTESVDVVVVQRPNSNATTVIDTAMESAFSQKGVIGPEVGGNAIRVFRGNASIAKVRGVPAFKVLNDNDYSALIGANPVTVPTLQIFAMDQPGTVVTTIYARVELTYHVQLYDRKVLTQS
jgi:hypothetical protein